MKHLLSSAFVILFVLTATHTHSQIITTIAGNGTWNFSGDGGPAAAALMSTPIDVYAASSGSIYIADRFNNRIRMINSAGIMTTVAGNGLTGFGGHGIPATSAGLSFPNGVSGDAAGNIFIADQGGHLIRRVTGGIIYHVAGIPGTTGYSGDGGPATAAAIEMPDAVYADAAGNVYFADGMNQVIRKVNPSGIITTFAGNGTGGYSGDGGAATAASINEPFGICMDAAGNLYVAEYSNHVVRKISAAGIISTYAGNGTLGFSGDGGPASAAKLNGPSGVSVDAAGNLYIADNDNRRIRKVTPYNNAVGNTAGNAATRLYPNPTGSVINIAAQQPVNIAVFAMDGKLLLEKKDTKKIDISHLPAGNYTIKLHDILTGAYVHGEVITKN